MSSYAIDSEVGRLRKVIIHRPGPEVEAMTPEAAEELLFNDIIPVTVVRSEHDSITAFLRRVCEVVEVEELVAQAFENPTIREGVIAQACTTVEAGHRRAELTELAPEELVSALVRGLPRRRDSLERYLSPRLYDIPPLPNLYFMRDAAMVYRDSVAIGAMAHPVRRLESLLVRAALGAAAGPAAAIGLGNHGGLLFDGAAAVDPEVRLEGGDFIVARRNLLLLGISERTSARAVDLLVQNIFARFGEPVTVLAVVLPHRRATIHLDMIFTFVDLNTALVYPPLITGPNRVQVVRMRFEPGRIPVIDEPDSVVDGLRSAGVPLTTVSCGGEDPLSRQREQWLSGTNVFAFAPGKIIGYACNVETLEALSKAGFTVRQVEAFLDGRDSVDEYDRLVVGCPGAELARGGGGVRCMTLPVEREPLGAG
ncbi:MAG TPA: arginine deiminase family protein [Spirochaetia bacterium]|nr:arginine deiminase family protein [Spirochaetia bacterium]